MKMTDGKRILWVLGAPASGKTTFINEGVEAARGVGRLINLVKDNDVLRDKICPRGGTSEKYHYDEDGNLIMEDIYRGEILDNLFGELAKRLAEAKSGLTVIEFTHPKLKAIMEEYFQTCIGNSAEMVFIGCGGDERLIRNHGRDRGEMVPEVYLGMFNQNYEQDFGQIKGLFLKSELIRNEEGLSDWVRVSREWWENYFL